MSEKVLSTLAAIITVGAMDARVGGTVERVELLGASAVVELTVDDVRYTVTIAENNP